MSAQHAATLQRRRRVSLVVLVCACLAFAASVAFNSRASVLSHSELKVSYSEPEVGYLPAGFDAADVQEGGEPGGAFSRFTHTERQHARLPCLLCHRRENNSPTPNRPGHMPCSGCHTQQFANQTSNICGICHTNPPSAAVKPFPRLRSFNVRFDHARHMRGAALPRAGCVACHKAERRGAALSIPAGSGAHSTCFQCHTPSASDARGGQISGCDTCHQLGSHVRTPTSARAFEVNFSHAEHGARRGLGCNDCHSVRAGAARAQQVTSPVAAQHHASARALSCMSCHNNRRAFGGDDFSDCKRCHEGETFRFGGRSE